MSMDPGTMQQLLLQKLQQPAQAGAAGGGQGGPQMQGNISPLNAAATLAQKAMLVRALQGQQQTQQANAMLPGTNAMMNAQNPAMQQGLQASSNQALSQTPQMQALQQQMQQPLPIPDPSLQPAPGVS